METTIEQPSFDTRMVTPFMHSVQTVLATMAGIETTVGPARIKTDSGPEHDCSGIIGFSGSIIGNVVVSFGRETALKLVAAFAGMEVELDSPDFCDALGELTNMIVGAAKQKLGGSSSITVPSVVIGKNHVICRSRDVPCVCFACQTSLGGFTVEVSVKSV